MFIYRFASVRDGGSREGWKNVANARGSSFERRTYQGLRFLDMFMAKEELAIQVAQVNSIEVDNVNFAEPSKDKVFEELAADATCADKQNTRLYGMSCVRRN